MRTRLFATISLLVLSTTVAVSAAPRIFWASDPVRPDETVMLSGSDLGSAAAVVEMARLDDANPSAPAPLPQITQWTRVAVVQGSDHTLKFVIPATWKTGVFACRVTVDGAASGIVLLNAPDPWWIQADEGDSGTPGGWLRVMGKSLAAGGKSRVILQPEQGEHRAPITLEPMASDGFSLRFDLPARLVPGQYALQVHNGCGGDAAWKTAGMLKIVPGPPGAREIFSVLEMYGDGAVNEMRKSLIKYNQPVDRTDGILAALKKAADAGGGIVYFPAGRYTVKGPLVVPAHTILKGEGMGLVTLWWGSGHFNLDGGGSQGRAKVDEPPPPHTLISGPDFAIEQMSLYLPVDYAQGIAAEDRLRMDHVRIRVDHYWLVQGRGGGTVAKLGRNFQVTNCDILAKGDGLVPGEFGVIAHNRILSNKSNTPMGGSRCVIIEDNQFVSMDPTTYQNIAGVGRNIYYGHNRHEAFYAQQSDYSFTFDAGAAAYLGTIAEVKGTDVTLSADPKFPRWAPENHKQWNQAALCILDGRGVGQWRDIVAHHGRSWQIDRPFDTPPDATSIASIVSFNGRVLIVANQFEDGNWVNAGYGTSIDVVCAENHLARCADLMNYGLFYKGSDFYLPSWHVQYFDNQVAEGQTHVGSSGDGHHATAFTGPLTRWCVHRRQSLSADNSGSITIVGHIEDAIVEGSTLRHALSEIKVESAAQGVVLRNNTFEGATVPRYAGDGLKNAVVLPSAR